MLRLGEILRGLTDPALQTLGRVLPHGRGLHGQVHPRPAGIKNHHAYPGGLLEHVVNLMEVVLRVEPLLPAVDRNLLLMGAFLHDLGKIDELRYDRELAYCDEGQLIGHLVMAVGMLEAKIAEAEKLSGEPLPAETVLRLKHMIVSHHGEYGYGSPKLPDDPGGRGPVLPGQPRRQGERASSNCSATTPTWTAPGPLLCEPGSEAVQGQGEQGLEIGDSSQWSVVRCN